ncbi:MAG: hypothetical protein F4X59_18440 [Holophagales bacterium]|nr:hypothetical protein [Holophagales bacterium]MYC12083.1 hypothetical protein [Holophagales bacterium]
MKNTITAVDECWQRNHMTRGEGRKALSVSAARETLIGRTGTVKELRELARPVAEAHLVTVTIRTAAGHAHLVSPA